VLITALGSWGTDDLPWPIFVIHVEKEVDLYPTMRSTVLVTMLGVRGENRAPAVTVSDRCT
jgi:hypothetical protein